MTLSISRSDIPFIWRYSSSKSAFISSLSYGLFSLKHCLLLTQRNLFQPHSGYWRVGITDSTPDPMQKGYWPMFKSQLGQQAGFEPATRRIRAWLWLAPTYTDTSKGDFCCIKIRPRVLRDLYKFNIELTGDSQPKLCIDKYLRPC